ncbi:MAG: D-alanyl-D-alanine carboxypeptidase family protein [Actinomycetota bacterium]
MAENNRRGAGKIPSLARRLGLGLGLSVMVLGVGAYQGAAQETTTTTEPDAESSSTTEEETTTSTTASTTASTASTTASSETTAAPTTAAPTTAAPTSSSTPASGAPDYQGEKEQNDAEEAARAAEVDAANAQVEDLAKAVATLKRRVNTQQSRVDYATALLAEAEKRLEIAEGEVTEAEEDLAVVETRVSDLAIRAFTDDKGERSILLAAEDPLDAIRAEVMRAEGTQTDLDVLEELRRAQEDVDVRRGEAAEAADLASRVRTESEDLLNALENDRTAQASLIAAAEDRLDHLLAEATALAAIGADDGRPVDDLVAELADSAGVDDPPEQITPPDVVSEDDIVYAGNGISVHADIVDEVRQLLVDAADDGINLGGGGYRSPAQQIAVRRNNCGTSNYAVYEMPASRCSPPTARPGRSMHEKGMAIDFTYNGTLIRSRSGAGWEWLKANAARYGLKNLPSEPWHWSINGN